LDCDIDSSLAIVTIDRDIQAAKVARTEWNYYDQS